MMRTSRLMVRRSMIEIEKRKDITLHACIHDAILCSIDKNKINSLKDITYLSDEVTNLKLPVNIEVY